MFVGGSGAVTLIHKEFAARMVRCKPIGVGLVLLRHAGAISFHCAPLKHVNLGFGQRNSSSIERNITGTNTQ